jgi:hypothetical protein
LKAHLSIAALLTACAISFGAFAGFGDIDPSFIPFSGGCNTIEPREDGGAYVDVRSDSQRVVARLDSHGALNASWGANGTVSYGGPSFPKISSLLRGNAGDLFIVDETGVVHVDATGHIDSSFGNGGRTELGPIYSAALQGGNRLVVLIRDIAYSGSPGQGGPPSYRFVRLTAAGAFDSSFGTFGGLSVPGTFDFGDVPYGWAVRSDGGVELGFYRDSFTSSIPLTLKLMVISADAAVSLASPGRVVPQGIASWMAAIAKTEPTGAFVIAGPRAELTRFNADGSFDAGFGGTGVVTYSSQNLDFTTPVSLWREPSGAWTILGDGTQNQGFLQIGMNQLRAIRFSGDGFPDTAFGKKLINNDGDHYVAHAPDGSMLHVDTSCMLHRYSGDAARAETSVVEYYHPLLDHYFMTSSANEVALLDGSPLGWIRTGASFGAWSPGALPGAAHVCRFYGDPVIGPNSHFYTGEDFECDLLLRVAAATPVGMPAWRLEGRPFDIAIPSNSVCPANLQPVYRVFNGIVGPVNGPNHRYTTDTVLYTAMQAKGWLPEGVHFCAPPRFN